ncbi:MAG: 3-dehydroquinate synthase [Commensalibacter sp.]
MSCEALLTTLNRPIVLIGLMGAGKTTIGKKLAQRLSLPFVDSDIEIEQTAGCSITDIFEQYGESEFRHIERCVIRRLIGEKPLILATGGGAFIDSETRAYLKEKAITIWLHCPLDLLLERVENRTHRPLLNIGDKRAILFSLMQTRYPIYAEADLMVQCQKVKIEESIEQVLKTLQKANLMQTLTVNLSQTEYKVLIGYDLLEQAGNLLTPVLKQKYVVIIADETVAKLHLERLRKSLDAASIHSEIFLIPPGENSKSFYEYERLTKAILEKGIERQTAIIAFGGGVTGDLSGFIASTLLRGIPFIQIPTTLLSQVDSSVGGKTAINTPSGKNLLGSFYQPKLVIADTTSLDTLPDRELRAGYAEILKASLIDDPDFFDWCEQYGEKVIARDPKYLTEAIKRACAFKARIIKNDEYEQNSKGRNLLNLGHSLGHALEAELNYDGTLLHGEAVALGCRLIFKLCVQLELCPQQDLDRLTNHLKAVGLPAFISDLPKALSVSRLMMHLHHDKKLVDGKITFILVNGIGKAFTSRNISDNQIIALLENEGCIQP